MWVGAGGGGVMANKCKAVQVAEVYVEGGMVTWDCSGWGWSGCRGLWVIARLCTALHSKSLNTHTHTHTHLLPDGWLEGRKRGLGGWRCGGMLLNNSHPRVRVWAVWAGSRMKLWFTTWSCTASEFHVFIILISERESCRFAAHTAANFMCVWLWFVIDVFCGTTR